MTASGAVEIDQVTRAFVEGGVRRVVLDDASARIETGEVVMLLGRSGSGKSTILNLVSGIDLPDSGEIRVGNLAVSTASENERTLFRRSNVGFVFQSFNLVPTLTVHENVELPLSLLGVDDAQTQERTNAALTDVGLEDRGGAFADNLSGGERQRVAVARALVHNPQLILADEPTGNLDVANAEAVLDLLLSMQRKHNATLIMATHSLDAARRADRILRVIDGKLRSESPDDL